MTLIPNHPYYHFEESDVFLFVENSSTENIYLIYNNEEVEEEDEEEGEKGEENNIEENSSNYEHFS